MIKYLIVLIVIWLSIMRLLVIVDKHKYNHGYCRNCGNKVRHFDDDSQGGHGFVCDNCGKDFWISWVKI